jgi:hypothetical protein
LPGFAYRPEHGGLFGRTLREIVRGLPGDLVRRTTIVMAGLAPAACAAPISKNEAAAANNGRQKQSRGDPERRCPLIFPPAVECVGAMLIR